MLTGCAAPAPKIAQESDIRTFQGRTLKTVIHESPPFALLSSNLGFAAFFGAGIGAMAGLSMERAGEKFIAAYSVNDPADTLATSLAQEIATAYRLRSTADQNTSTQNGLELHVKTNFWAFGTTRTTGENWNIMYWPKFQLKDTQTGKVYAEYNCVYKRQQTPSGLTMDELVEADALQFKSILNEIANECKEEFKISFLGIKS